jgi:SecD/SecF fusion protein
MKDLLPTSTIWRGLLVSLAVLAVYFVGPVFQFQALAATELEHVVLVYEVDPASLAKGEKVDMKKLVAAVARRVNTAGLKEIILRPRASDQIEIIIPKIEKEKLERFKRLISRPGSLEFRILANNPADKDVIERAKADPSKMQLFDGKDNLQAWWVPVSHGREKIFEAYPEIARRTRKTPKGDLTEVLVVKDDYDVNGGYLTQAASDTDRKGNPCVSFKFNTAGGQLFGLLTGNHLPDELTDFSYKLAIILDGEIYSAPSIKARIFDSGIIEGHFTQEEVEDQVNMLNNGSLPARIRLVSEEDSSKARDK